MLITPEEMDKAAKKAAVSRRKRNGWRVVPIHRLKGLEQTAAEVVSSGQEDVDPSNASADSAFQCA